MQRPPPPPGRFPPERLKVIAPGPMRSQKRTNWNSGNILTVGRQKTGLRGSRHRPILAGYPTRPKDIPPENLDRSIFLFVTCFFTSARARSAVKQRERVCCVGSYLTSSPLKPYPASGMNQAAVKKNSPIRIASRRKPQLLPSCHMGDLCLSLWRSNTKKMSLRCCGLWLCRGPRPRSLSRTRSKVR